MKAVELGDLRNETPPIKEKREEFMKKKYEELGNDAASKYFNTNPEFRKLLKNIRKGVLSESEVLDFLNENEKGVFLDLDIDTGLQDSATGESCKMDNAVDITEYCPNVNKEKERVVFLYTNAKRGPIIQIRSYGIDDTKFELGSCIHFFINELDSEMNMDSRNDTFGSRAKILGIRKEELRNLIEKYAV